MAHHTMGLSQDVEPQQQGKKPETALMMNAIGSNVNNLNRAYQAALADLDCEKQPDQPEVAFISKPPFAAATSAENDVDMTNIKAAAPSVVPAATSTPSHSLWKDVPQVSTNPSPTTTTAAIPEAVVPQPPTTTIAQHQPHQLQQSPEMLAPPTGDNDQPFVNVYMVIDPKSMTCLIPQQTISCKRNNVVATAVMGPRVLSAPQSSLTGSNNRNPDNNGNGSNQNMNETAGTNAQTNSISTNASGNSTTTSMYNSNDANNDSTSNNSTTSSSLLAQINNNASFSLMLQQQYQLDESLVVATGDGESRLKIVTPSASVSSSSLTSMARDEPEGYIKKSNNKNNNKNNEDQCLKIDHIGKEAEAVGSSFSSSLLQQQDPLPPLRALSAYNFFFRDERERILHPDVSPDWSETKKTKLLQEHWWQDRTKKRKHRKTHGKINFTTLSKLISARWRELPEDRKDFYRQIASRDFQRFKQENDTYQQDASARSQLPRVPAMIAPAAVVG